MLFDYDDDETIKLHKKPYILKRRDMKYNVDGTVYGRSSDISVRTEYKVKKIYKNSKHADSEWTKEMYVMACSTKWGKRYV